MRVCDRCGNVHAPAKEFKVTMSAPADPSAERQRHSRVRESLLELCEECREPIWKVVEDALAVGKAALASQSAKPPKSGD